MGIHLALQIGAHRLEFRHVDGNARCLPAVGRSITSSTARWPATTAVTRLEKVAPDCRRWRRLPRGSAR